MTAPAQFAFTDCGKLVGVRAHGRVVWLPPDFVAPVRALQDAMDTLNAAQEMWRDTFRRAMEEAERSDG
jgi:hypothetical protein